MTVTQIMNEYRAALKRIQTERDLYRELLLDQVQMARKLERADAKTLVDQELLKKLKTPADDSALPPYCVSCHHRHILNHGAGIIGECSEFDCDCTEGFRC